MISAVPLFAWVVTLTFLALVVAMDLVVISRRKTVVTLVQATRWVVLYVALALTFGAVVGVAGGGKMGTEFVAGYITEYSLSADNLFIFVIIMQKLSVPQLARDKVLYIGILVSMVLRAVFILAGARLIAAAAWSFYLFGLVLVYTAVTLLRDSDGAGEFTEGRLLRGLRLSLPLTESYVGDRLAVRVNGHRMVTPLVIAIAAIGIANVVFALDSIPAIFGLTQDAFVIITANAFALMGLRQLYFLVGSLLERLVYLNVGLAAILAFIGLKLVVEGFRRSHIFRLGFIQLPAVGTVTSLIFIVLVLGIASFASLFKVKRDARKNA
jgi:tellurite resistance protein TerC